MSTDSVALCYIVSAFLCVSPTTAQDWAWQRDDLVLNPSGLDLTGATSWAFGDLDRDGRVDIIVRKNGMTVNSRLVAYRGRDGSEPPYWQQAPDLLTGLDEDGITEGIVLIDLDGDHELNLVTAFEVDPLTFTWKLIYWQRDSARHWQPDSSVFQGIDLGLSYAPLVEPNFADIDDDGDLDMVFGSLTGDIHDGFRFYENVGATSKPIWEEQPRRLALVNQSPAGYETWSPTFRRVNEDDLLDLVVAYTVEDYTGLAAYPGMMDGLELRWDGNPDYRFQTFYEGGIRKVIFSDLDSDNAPELIILELKPSARVYPYSQSPTSASYFRLGPINFFSHATAQPFDYNHDQSTDLLATGLWIGFGGPLILFESYEQSDLAQWRLWKHTDWLNSPIRIHDLAQVKIGLTDIDRNGLPDFVISSQDSRPNRTAFLAFENSDPRLQGDWEKRNDLIAPFYNDWLTADTSYFEPSFGDLDGDGDPDVLTKQKLYLGPDSGKSVYRIFENEVGSETILWRPRPDWVTGLEDTLFYYGNFGDLDLDGDPDLVFSTSAGKLILYENIGTSTTPKWRANEEAFARLRLERFTAPALGDFDGDGKPDLFAGDRNGNVFFYRNQTIVHIQAKTETEPLVFTLFQNYPNPFNPETTIEYELTQAGQVQLSIYNVRGQHVRTLVHEWQPAGAYRINWDGTSEQLGVAAPSGIYFYEIKHEDLLIRRKMALIR